MLKFGYLRDNVPFSWLGNSMTFPSRSTFKWYTVASFFSSSSSEHTVEVKLGKYKTINLVWLILYHLVYAKNLLDQYLKEKPEPMSWRGIWFWVIILFHFSTCGKYTSSDVTYKIVNINTHIHIHTYIHTHTHTHTHTHRK